MGFLQFECIDSFFSCIDSVIEHADNKPTVICIYPDNKMKEFALGKPNDDNEDLVLYTGFFFRNDYSFFSFYIT